MQILAIAPSYGYSFLGDQYPDVLFLSGDYVAYIPSGYGPVPEDWVIAPDRTIVYKYIYNNEGSRDGVEQAIQSTLGAVAVRKEEPFSRHFSHNMFFNGKNGYIAFDVEKSGRISLWLCNAIGRMIKELVSGEISAGRHNVNAGQLNAGVYFAILETTSGSDVFKIVAAE